MKIHPSTIPDNTSFQKYAPKSIPKPPDLACGHFLEPGASREGVSPKDWNMKVSPFTIPNNTFLSIDALKSMAGPPDLALRILFLTWAHPGISESSERGRSNQKRN